MEKPLSSKSKKKQSSSAKKPAAKKKEIESPEWKDLGQLPLEIRREAALSFDWKTLQKGCGSKELKLICNDPDFWLKKLHIEKLTLLDPEVIDWIKLWIGTPEQTRLLKNLSKGTEFNLPLIGQLLITEKLFEGDKEWKDENMGLNPDPLVTLIQKLYSLDKDLIKNIPRLLLLETAQINFNFGANLIRKRKSIVDFILRATKNSETELINLSEADYIYSEVPALKEDSEEEGTKFKTYAQYLDSIKNSKLDLSEFFYFLHDISIHDQLTSADPEEPELKFEEELKDPVKYKYYRRMVIKKAELLGLHLKIGDILRVGVIRSSVDYFVIRDKSEINLHILFKDSLGLTYLPKEAIPLLIYHNVKTLDDLEILRHSIIGFETPNGLFELSSEGSAGTNLVIQGHTFYGKYHQNNEEEEEED